MNQENIMKNSCINSERFSKIKDPFTLSDSDLKFDESFKPIINANNDEILIVPVYKQGTHSAYLWIYKKNNEFTTLYESLTFINSTLSNASLYSESIFFITSFEFEKHKEGLQYSIITKNLQKTNTIKKLASSIDDLPILDPCTDCPNNDGVPIYSQQEKYVDCVVRVYQEAKKACEADPGCDTLCDFTPGCHASMLAAAVYTCL